MKDEGRPFSIVVEARTHTGGSGTIDGRIGNGVAARAAFDGRESKRMIVAGSSENHSSR